MRNQPLPFAIAGFLLACLAGLTVAFLRVTTRYGEALLRIDRLQSRRRPKRRKRRRKQLSNHQLLFIQGIPPGSVATNFSLPALDGRTIQLFELRGRRVMVIFISPDCPESRAMLPSLATFGTNDDILLISHGTQEENQTFVAGHGISLPLLLQDRNELSRVYYLEATPSAYVINAEGQTETPRIVGAASVLGQALAFANGQDPLSENTSPVGLPMPPTMTRIGRADDLPHIQVPLLHGGILDTTTMRGRRWLLVLIDPLSSASIDLLPDLAVIHENPESPNVVVISRRDPELTKQLARDHSMPYLIGVQEHHNISRQLGTLVTPAACIVATGGYLESDFAIGQQAIFALLKPLRPTEPVWRTRSLSSLLQRQGIS